MKSICVWGTSLKKIGDEAQNIAFLRIIRMRYPDVRITLFSQFGERMTRQAEDEGIEVTTIRTARLFGVFGALARSDLFVFEGGPFYEDLPQALHCLMLFGMAKILGLPVIVYGATAFQFRTWWGRRLYRAIFDRVDVLTVRETVAVEILKDLGVKKKVTLFADPRFILDPPPPAGTGRILREEGIDPEESFIILTTRYLHPNVPQWVKRSHSYQDKTLSRANEVMARMAAHLEESAQLLILPMHPSLQEDEEMAQVLRTYMKDPSHLKVLSRRYTAMEIIGMIDRAEMIIASRLGSAVFAAITGTPIVSIAYEPRMVDHMKRIGLGKYVTDWKDLNFDDLLEKIKEVRSDRDAIRERLKSQVHEFKNRAWNNAEILNEFV